MIHWLTKEIVRGYIPEFLEPNYVLKFKLHLLSSSENYFFPNISQAENQGNMIPYISPLKSYCQVKLRYMTSRNIIQT